MPEIITITLTLQVDSEEQAVALCRNLEKKYHFEKDPYITHQDTDTWDEMETARVEPDTGNIYDRQSYR